MLTYHLKVKGYYSPCYGLSMTDQISEILCCHEYCWVSHAVRYHQLGVLVAVLLNGVKVILFKENIHWMVCSVIRKVP